MIYSPPAPRWLRLWEVIDQLSAHFKLQDLGEPTHFLGITLYREGNTLMLFQAPYLQTVLARFKLEDVKERPIPMNPNIVLERYDDDEIHSKHKATYASAVGALTWAANATRPDIAYATLRLARYSSNPGPQHFKALIQLFGYIKKTINLALHYNGDGGEELSAFCDSDFAGCPDSAKSTGGQLVMLGNCTIGWSSKLQGLVTRSSTEVDTSN
jgi:hypothetical protein